MKIGMWAKTAVVCFALAAATATGSPADLDQSANTWVKRSPLDDTPPSPRMGYEGACAWDGRHRLWIRYGGHNQGGGGEQNSELWTYDPLTSKWTLTESSDSVKARTQPRIVEDLVVSVRSPQKVELEWTPPQAKDIVGFVVERAPVEVWTEDQLKRQKSRTPPLEDPSVGAVRRIGPFVRLNAEPLKTTTFTDSVDLTRPATLEGRPLLERKLYAEQLDLNGKPYRFAVFAYRVRAVNALGVESGPSPYSLTIPSAPQWVFSKEDGTSCRLKWRRNPEKNIKGYRIYRLDGRWEKDPVSRLTSTPITDTTFVDETAGTTTRRYYVVAVDGLGQEGFPSRPVWFDREWKRFYKPFVGEWHQ